MLDQKEAVINNDWKNLVVLDACRYDYFLDLCDFSGDLKKAHSPAFQGEGAPTSVWYRNIFREKHEDIIHISSHPRVNSKMEVEGFEGGKHFFKVADLWEEEWNEEMGTVLPEDVTRRALEHVEEFPDKRFILHYMQPHTPYLSLGPPSTKKRRNPESRESFMRRLRNFAVSKARNIIGDKRAVDMMEFFKVPPLSPMDDALRKVGEEGVRKAYKDNLSRVLKSVENFLDKCNGKCVITSDHGELLGEGGRYGHELKECPELIEVPWLEIEAD